MKHLVGLSGGIDSQACALWCRREFGPENVICINSDAGGNEHPLTTEHLHYYAANVHPVVFLTAIVADMDGRERAEIERRGLKPTDPLTFVLLAEIKKWFPSRLYQVCTYHLKLLPQKRWIDANSDLLAEGFIRYAGVRGDESQDRAELPERQWDDTFDCELVRPVLRWTKKQCFNYVVAAGEEFNPLYKLGFARVGCAPCVNSSKGDVLQWATRFPEMIDKVREWERIVGKTFFKPCVPGMEINWIDDVVAWAKTERGGKQISLPFAQAEADMGSCASKYGLCE